MESWKRFTESLNEQDTQTAKKPIADVKPQQEPKPSGAKKFKYEGQLPKDPAGRESLLMQMTPEGEDYLLNKIPFSLKFDVDTSNKEGIILITVQSKLDPSLVYSRKFSGLDIGDIDLAKRTVMRDFFRTNNKALQIHKKMEDGKYAAFKKAWGHYWLTKQKQANAPVKKIQQDTKKAIQKSVKKAETKIKPEKIKKTPEVVKVKKAAVQKKATPVNAPVQKKAAPEVATPAANDIVKKVQSGKWTKGGKSFPKANPEVINLIYKLQGLIGATQDGVFGKETAKAIQRKYYGK